MNYFSAFQSLGRVIAFYPKLVKPLGSVNACILFCQLLYWSDKTNSKRGVYKTIEQLTEETGLSRREQETACKKLTSIGVLFKDYDRLNHRMYYRLIPEKFNELMSKLEEKDAEQNEQTPPRNQDLECEQNEHTQNHKTGSRIIEHRLHTQDYKHNITKDINAREKKQRTSATQSALPRENKTKPKNASPTQNEQMSLLVNLGVDEQMASDYLAVRKAKRAPLTLTAIKGIEREANKAGISVQEAICISTENGWAGFRADWFERISKISHTSTHNQSKRSVKDVGNFTEEHNQFDPNNLPKITPDEEIDF